MSLVTIAQAAAYLGLSVSTAGLQEAVDMAEDIAASQIGCSALTQGNVTEDFRFRESQINLYPSDVPVTAIQLAIFEGDDVTESLAINPGGWSLSWKEPLSTLALAKFRDSRRFLAEGRMQVSYQRGWTASTLPPAIQNFVKVWTGKTLLNLAASGVYDVKLGDMTVKLQRETEDSNMRPYNLMLSRYVRPRL